MNNREEEIRRGAYQKYMERVRQGLTVDFEPDRTILEKRDYRLAEFEVNQEMRAQSTR